MSMSSGASLGAHRWGPGPTNRPQGPTNNLLHIAIFRLIIVYKCQISQPNGAGSHQSIFPNDAPGWAAKKQTIFMNMSLNLFNLFSLQFRTVVCEVSYANWAGHLIGRYSIWKISKWCLEAILPGYNLVKCPKCLASWDSLEKISSNFRDSKLCTYNHLELIKLC